MTILKRVGIFMVIDESGQMRLSFALQEQSRVKLIANALERCTHAVDMWRSDTSTKRRGTILDANMTFTSMWYKYQECMEKVSDM